MNLFRNLGLTLCLSIGIASASFGQGSVAWYRSYNGSKNADDIATRVATDSKGNVYIAGHSNEGDSGWDMTLIKFDPKGKQLWINRYNGPDNQNDYAYGVAVDSSDNVYLAGTSYSVKNGSDFLVVKYTSAGTRLWTKRADGSHRDDSITAMTLDAAGNVYVTGITTTANAGRDYMTLKIDTSGNEKWRQTFNGAANGEDIARAIAVDQNGNVYVTGQSYQGRGPEIDFMTIKYSFRGELEWAVGYNGSGNGNDIATSIGVDKQGNVYVAGISDGSNGTGADYLTLKYNSDGKQLWAKRYNGSGTDETGHGDYCNSMVVDASGNVYVTGASMTATTGQDIVTIKYTTSGSVAWKVSFDGVYHDNDLGYAIAVDAKGNVWVTGLFGKGSNPTDVVVQAYSASGKRFVNQTFNGGANGADYGNSIAVDSAGNAFIAGVTTNTAGNLDFLLLSVKP